MFVHGFPELAYSWRHQLPALAEAGRRAIAFDLRGYGRSSKPEAVEAYSLESLVGDVIGLLDSLGLDRVALVGHDWGSIVLWSTVVLHPDRVASAVSLNVPYRGWCCGFPNTQIIEKQLADRFSYVLSFQEAGRPEKSFEKDPAGWLGRIYRGVAREPDFMTDDEFAVYLDAFAEGGISGPINYYRNIDANWAATAYLADRSIEAPTLVIAADSDPILPVTLTEGMDRWVKDLRVEVVEYCGHWTQQEQPERVNELLVEFFGSIGS
ncbi:MAG: alpha/beta fold hydrolase [Acidimicrobiia bacterium]